MNINVNLDMTNDRDGVTDNGRAVPVGTTVTYKAHVIGGMVRVRFADGFIGVMDPNCFPTLREEAPVPRLSERQRMCLKWLARNVEAKATMFPYEFKAHTIDSLHRMGLFRWTGYGTAQDASNHPVITDFGRAALEQK